MTNTVNILVVDDDPDVIEQVAVMLKADGYDVTAAGGEVEAREALLSCRPDLAIVDLMMESTDSGFVLAHHLKKLYPGTPVILLTAVAAATGMSFAGGGESRSWIESDCVLDKPVRPEQLRSCVTRLLGAARA
jgi:CheY-like chemotaxis protein